MKAFIPPHTFHLGCNYWASHAGTGMWRDWQPDTIRADFAALHQNGLQLLRVFPLWSDFQPLHLLTGGNGVPVEFRFGETPLPDTPAGQAGLDEAMLDRFRQLADLAHENGFQLIVGLVTGWMSGRLFLPPAFSNRNPITDPLVIQWEVRFVRHFVETLKGHPAIAAWDLGNECNVMGQNPTSEQAWLWTASITNAIRSADPSRPIVSGMHSLAAEPGQPWGIRDQAELTDFLTTHPYPIFTPHIVRDPANTLRPILHATAESLFYADIGGKPCFAEEMGTTGPYILADSLTEDFARASLFSLWAHDCRAALWWCAFDQTHLENAPYDWCPVEHELGLLTRDRLPKPNLQAFADFRRFLDSFECELPLRSIEATCILTQGQDQWGVADAAFLLAKQAGLDVRFRMADQTLPDSPLYLLPSTRGLTSIRRRHWLALLERIHAGATLYISLDDAVMSGLNEAAGVEFLTRARSDQPFEYQFDNSTIRSRGETRFTLRPTRAQVLACDEKGNPIFTHATYGKGHVYLLTHPLEIEHTLTSGSYQHAGGYRIYEAISAPARADRICHKASPFTGVTEHTINANERIITIINYSNKAISDPFRLAPGWDVTHIHYGQANGIPARDALVITTQFDTKRSIY
jgi:endo-1,4-beta-mannosidase